MVFPRTDSEVWETKKKIGTIESGRDFLNKKRKIIFKNKKKTIKYLTVPINQAWNLTSNNLRIVVQNSDVSRETSPLGRDKLIFFYVTGALWRDLIKTFEKLWQRKKRGMMQRLSRHCGRHVFLAD